MYYSSDVRIIYIQRNDACALCHKEGPACGRIPCDAATCEACWIGVSFEYILCSLSPEDGCFGRLNMIILEGTVVRFDRRSHEQDQP